MTAGGSAAVTARPPKILLPTELMVRCADSTEVIGNACAAKARSAPVPEHRCSLRAAESTVRRCMRRTPQWPGRESSPNLPAPIPQPWVREFGLASLSRMCAWPTGGNRARLS